MKSWNNLPKIPYGWQPPTIRAFGSLPDLFPLEKQTFQSWKWSWHSWNRFMFCVSVCKCEYVLGHNWFLSACGIKKEKKEIVFLMLSFYRWEDWGPESGLILQELNLGFSWVKVPGSPELSQSACWDVRLCHPCRVKHSTRTLSLRQCLAQSVLRKCWMNIVLRVFWGGPCKKQLQHYNVKIYF